MPTAGSFQRIADSALLPYVAVHLYCTTTFSLSAQNPRAKPEGTQTCFMFSAEHF